MKQHIISPDTLTHNSLHARMQLTHSLVRLFNRQRSKATAQARALYSERAKIWQHVKDPKADKLTLRKESADEIAEALYRSIMDEWESLPDSAKEDLLGASMSGAGKGAIQLHVHDVEVISAINQTAKDWAEHRAAELVGMRYDDDGNLHPNPNAKWAITDTTRDELRRIVENAFTKETPLDELIQEIETAGAFSSERAALIATTEVQFAQAHGNYAAWQESGLVLTVTWLLSEDHDIPCECEDNEDVVVNVGEPFPSGHLAPPAHPRCMCLLATAELAD